MPLIHDIDRVKFTQHKPLYKGSGVPFKPLNNKQMYLPRNGGLIDFGNILNMIQDNKDLISSGVNTVGNIASAVKSVSDTVKKAKELEEVKTIKDKKKKNKEIEITDAQRETLKSIGDGFAFFGGNR